MTPRSILVGALGGEGGGVLAQWVVEAAAAAGYPAQSTSIPGVAQRTGATTYYIEVFPQRCADLRGREPVLSLLPVPGAIDLVVASEVLEAARMAGSGMVSPDRTLLVTSTGRTLTTLEKMAPGDGRFDAGVLQEVLCRHSARCIAFDMAEAAREAGTAVSAVMFGAIAASGVLPVGRGACEAVIRADDRGAEASLRGFATGYAAVQGAAATRGAWDRRRQQRGKAPLAVALRVRTDRIGGFLALRVLASLKGLRRRGARYAQEQADIERWLAAVEAAADVEWARAHELVLCGRLVKGYGATNERTKRNLMHIVTHLSGAPAAAIREAREAALADEGGAALDRALVAHGAPARPVAAQPIRWTRRPRNASTPGAR